MRAEGEEVKRGDACFLLRVHHFQTSWLHASCGKVKCLVLGSHGNGIVHGAVG